MKEEILTNSNAEGTPLRRVQLKALEILDAVTDIFDRNGIPYWIEGGTLLGAVRHGGFIPWDDDVDIDVPAKYYRKAIKVLCHELPDSMCIQVRKWIKVRDRYSELVETGSDHLRQRGIFIDIFKASKLGAREHRIKKALRAKMDELIQRGRLGARIERSFVKLAYYLTGLLFFWEKRSVYISHSVFVRYGFPLTLVNTLGRITFEGREYSAPNDVDEYLTLHYGDYMKLPPPEERVHHASKVIFLDGYGERKEKGEA